MIPELTTLLLLLLGTILALAHFRSQALRDRFEMYQAMESAITEEQITLAEQLPEEYFDLNAFEEHYKGRRDKILRYLAMIQRYHYTIYSRGYNIYLIDPYFIKLKTWIRELAKIAEFQDVHRRYRRYYPGFTKYIERIAPELKENNPRPCQQPEIAS